MASTFQPDSNLLSLLHRTYPSAVPSESASDIDSDPVKLSSSMFPDVVYNEADKTGITQFLVTSSHVGSRTEDSAKSSERLSALNTHLATRTTVLGGKPSIADVAIYTQLAPQVARWSPEERTGENGYHHIVRFVDYVEKAQVYGLKLSDSDKVNINPDEVLYKIPAIDPRKEKERKKKEKEAAVAGATSAAAAGATPTDIAEGQEGKKSKKDKGKDKAKDLGETVAAAVGAEQPGVAQPSAGKPKKEKQPKQPKAAPAPEKPLSPALIDLRVGHILKAVTHPNADSLYVSTIACGDAPGSDNTSEYEGQVVRTVCSGLNGLIPLEEMQDRKIVVVCNLKPVTMRGIKSAAMVLAASPRNDDSHAGPVELVIPPKDAKAGERVYFEGYEGEPESVLNPKKKVWETVQPGFTTTDNLEVGFDVSAVPAISGEGSDAKSGIGKLRTKEGVCTVPTLKGATVR